MRKSWLIQAVLLAQAGIGIALGFYLAHALRELYSQQFPMVVMFSHDDRNWIYAVEILVLLLAPLAKGICVSAALIWWLSQQRKLLESVANK